MGSRSLWIVMVFLLLVSLADSAAAQEGKNPTTPEVGPHSNWTVEDNIKIDRLGIHLNSWNFNVAKLWSGIEDSFKVSPNGEYVTFNILSSNLAKDEVAATLRVFDVKALRRFADGGRRPDPIFVKNVTTDSKMAGIGQITWSPDSAALFYLAMTSEEPELRIWEVGKTDDRAVKEVQKGVYKYQLVGSDHIAIFRQNPASELVSKDLRDHRSFTATGYSYAVLAHPEMAGSAPLSGPSTIELVNWRDRSVKPARINALVQHNTSLGPSPAVPLSVSPDGSRFAFGEVIAARHSGYCWRPDLLSLPPEERPRTNRKFGYTIAFYDVKTKRIHRPFNAPVGLMHPLEADDVFWSDDSNMAIIPNTYLETDECRRADSVISPGAYSYDFSTKRTSLIAKYERDETSPLMLLATDVNWSSGEFTLALRMQEWLYNSLNTMGEFDEWRTFAFRNGVWSISSENDLDTGTDAAFPMANAVLELREEYNTAPAIYAFSSSGKSRMLIDLAPHARGRTFGSVEVIEWQDGQGRTWEGLLALPPGYIKGNERLPLLIQSHWSHDVFFAEGPSFTAYPGRAMLDRGYAVLTFRHSQHWQSLAEEGRNALTGFRSAIEHLHQLGIVDRKQVGAIGWSRGSFAVRYALTHDPDLLAAGVVSDGFDKGYIQLLFQMGLAGAEVIQRSNTRSYGTLPWPLSDTWRDEAPTFNAHKVTAPVRIEATGGTLINEWDFYAALRYLGKPVVDLFYHTDGWHVLTRPSERYASTQGSIDWIDFWINGFVDPDPAKADQYERWLNIREERCVWGDQKNKPRYCDLVASQ